MLIAVVAIVGGVALFAWREMQHALVVKELTSAITAERSEYIALIDRVCQRVQAPEQAVYEHFIGQVSQDGPRPVAEDDDEAYDMPAMTREELADWALQAEIAGSVTE